MDFIKARIFTPGRKTPVRVVVLHTMEAAEKRGTALAVANWFAGRNAPQASAHYCVDSAEVIQCVDESDTAWAAPGANADGIQIEMAGYSGQGASGWEDEYSQEMLRRVADLVRDICIRRELPMERVDSHGLLEGAKGITSHHAVSLAYKRSTHTDPGPDFPWDKFLAMVRGEAEEPHSPKIGIYGPAEGVLLRPTWVEIAPGVDITADALKWTSGYRVVASPQNASRLAVAFDAFLPTPELLDLAYAKVGPTGVVPYPMRGCPTSREAAEAHSREIDRMSGGSDGLIAPTGKQWVIPLLGRPGNRAAEYGWHVPVRVGEGTTWRGIPIHKPASGDWMVIQPEMYGHGLTHCDYSRFVRLVRFRTASAMQTHFRNRNLGYL